MKCSKYLKRSLPLILVLFGIFAGSAHAEKWYFEPVFKARLGYDDNIRFTNRFEDSAFSGYLMADARFGARTEVSEANFGLKLDTRSYDGHSDLNTSNQFFDMDLAYTTGLHTFRLGGAYYNDSTRTSELLTTGFLATTIDRTYYDLSPTWEWQMNERTSLQAGYEYSKSEYDDDRPTGGLIDYRYDTAYFSGAYQLTERTQLTGSINAAMYEADDVFSENDSYGLMLGVQHQFDETLSLVFSAGPRYTEFDYRDFSGRKTSSDDTTYLAELRLSKRYETLNADVVLRSFENPSSSGRLLRTQSAVLDLDGQLSARWSYGLGTGFYRNETTGGVDDDSQDRDYFFFQPHISWKATPWWTITGSYRYRSQEYTELDSDRATSNAVFLTINYVWPRESLARWMEL